MIDLIQRDIRRGFEFQDVIGRNIVCEDGVTRRVQSIVPSFAHYDMVLINEEIEDETPGGAWVHVLSLHCQMHGKPPPTPDQKAAASREWLKLKNAIEETGNNPVIIRP